MEETEHILQQQHTQPIHKPCITLHKGPDSENLPETTGEKVRKENKRVIVRSSYFKHKPECNEEQIVTPVVASFTSNSCDSSITKRKASPNENIQMVCTFMQLFY